MGNQEREDLLFDGQTIDFKPMSKGLGFHHGSEVRHPVKPKRQATRSQAPSRAGDLTRRLLEKSEAKPVQEVTDSDLASTNRKVVAWLIDVALVSLLVVLSLLVFQRFSGVAISDVVLTLGGEQALYAVGSLYVVYYLLYFTLLDLVGTPGKHLLSIRLSGQSGPQSRFMRAFVTLTWGCLLFIPALLSWEDKISGTTVRKR